MYDNLADIDFSLDDLSDREDYGAVLLVEPTYFDVEYELEDNTFMDEEYKVDRAEAWTQWQAMKDTYEELGVETHVLDGVEGLPDMVFTANHALPYEESGEKKVVLSNMKHAERDPEVAYVVDWFTEQGYELFNADGHMFEGTGDAVWHPKKELLWAGHGVRTDKAVYETVRDAFDVPIITLELDSANPWYHLDTCFAPVDEDTVLAYMDAFSEEDQDKIRHVFSTVIEVPEAEAVNGLAANAHSPDGEHILIQAGNEKTRGYLQQQGFTVEELDTGQFLKSGGSVYCMKLVVPE